MAFRAEDVAGTIASDLIPTLNQVRGFLVDWRQQDGLPQELAAELVAMDEALVAAQGHAAQVVQRLS